MAIKIKSKPSKKRSPLAPKRGGLAAVRERTERQKRTKTKKKPASTNHRPSKELTDRDLKRILDPLSKLAAQRDEIKDEYKNLVLAIQLESIKASHAGVPLAKIAKAGNFSRQYFYQIERDYAAGKLDPDYDRRSNMPASQRNGTKRKRKRR